jgi:hypothetical protein
MRTWHLSAIVAGLTLLAAAGCSRDIPNRPGGDAMSGATGRLATPARLVAPTFDSTAFRTPRPNGFFPLVQGTLYEYAGRADSDSVTAVTAVTDQRRTILGVSTVVVTHRVFGAGQPIEDTSDFFANDDAGNVWFMGRDTRALRGGIIVSTQGSWVAGVNGALPGLIMPANPHVGDVYHQQFVSGVAEGMASVFTTDQSVAVPAGKFTGALGTMEWSPLLPGVREAKYYARGVGDVLEVAIEGATGRLALQSVGAAAAVDTTGMTAPTAKR